MPYAYGATIQHEYNVDHLNVWLTFRHQMLRSLDYSADPIVYDVFPPLAKWLIEADSVAVDAVASEWVDEFTLLITSDTVVSRPAKVTVAYDGPDSGLAFRWGKDIEPWGDTLSTDLTATLWIAGMIILWSGAVVDIPSGWHLCDGTEGTPDLRDRFIIGAGTTYSPGNTGGNLTHTHAATQAAHTHTPGALGGTLSIVSPTNVLATSTPAITVPSTNHLPPYYALCYIMKL